MDRRLIRLLSRRRPCGCTTILGRRVLVSVNCRAHLAKALARADWA